MSGGSSAGEHLGRRLEKLTAGWSGSASCLASAGWPTTRSGSTAGTCLPTTQASVTQSILTTFPEARSFADVGAAGTYAAELRRRGVRAVACEKALFGRAFSYWQRLRSRSFDLTRQPPAHLPLTDVAYCLEVGEHLPPELGDRLVAYLAQLPTLLFTAAHPGQAGTITSTSSPKDYWIEGPPETGWSSIPIARTASSRRSKRPIRRGG